MSKEITKKEQEELKEFKETIEEYLRPFEDGTITKTFPKLRSLYLLLGKSRQNISSGKTADSKLLRMQFDTIKEAKDRIVVCVLDGMAMNTNKVTVGIFYLKAIEKETFNDRIVATRDSDTQRLSNEVDNSIEPVTIVMGLPDSKQAGKKIVYKDKEVD